MLASACTSSEGAGSGPEGTQPEGTTNSNSNNTTAESGVALINLENGQPLEVALSTGTATGEEVAEPVALVAGESLTDAQIEAVIGRVPDWTENPDDRAVTNRPVDSLRPPRVGETVDVPFGGETDDDIPTVPTGPVEVLRYQPDGDVAIAPTVSVTFNQPMVPIGTLGQLAAENVPATLDPAVPGRWEWIGTRTLRFEAEVDGIDRLPMATEFTVTIPAGTAAVGGGELAEAVTFSFTTPTVQVERLAPNGGAALSTEPVFFAHFDQRIDRNDVVEALTILDGGTAVAVRLATEAEIEADEIIANLVENATEDRWVAFRADEPLQTDSDITVRIGPNTPSAEGSRTSADPYSENFRTYAPLRVLSQSCEPEPCEPGRGLFIEFNNALADELFDPALVTVEPELTGQRIVQRYNGIGIAGATVAQTTYTVTIDEELTDQFGQQLSADLELAFEIGDAEPRLVGFRRPITIVDPLNDSPGLSVTVMNHDELRVRIYEVDPAQWKAFLDTGRGSDETTVDPPGNLLSDEVVSTGAPENRLHEAQIDLSAALDGANGQLVVVVEPTGDLANLTREDDLYWQNRPTFTWAQATTIGADVFTDGTDATVWATDLTDGTPLAGVELSLFDGDTTATTDSDGIAEVRISSADSDYNDLLLVARKGDDLLLLPGDWWSDRRTDSVAWHVFDDRQTYRPGETAHLKGWVRNITSASDTQLALMSADTVAFTAFDPQGVEIGAGTTEVSSAGGFDFTIDIPAGANLGSAWVQLELPGSASTNHQIQIQEFRRPEFEVSTRIDTEGPYLATDPTTVAVDAAYFAGGPLPNAAVAWTVTTRPASYAPPGWKDYSFGTWVPWWRISHGEDGYSDFDDFGPGSEDDVQTFEGLTGADGTHLLQMDFTGDGEGRPTTVTAAATVTDVNRQQWSDSTGVLVHPAATYVGLRSDRPFVKAGEDIDVSAVVVGIDGEIEEGREVTIEAARLAWRFANGSWDEEAIDAQRCEATSSADPIACTFGTDIGGRYRITAIVTDGAGRQSTSELTRWVSGGRSQPRRNVEMEEATLIPNAEDYAPGDTAEILVEAPFADASGLLTVSRNGFLYTESFTIDGTSTVLDVPIETEHIPNLHVQVDLAGATERTDDLGNPLEAAPDRPAFASGRLALSIPPTERTLDITVTPSDPETEPGSATSVDVAIVDAAGNPVSGAELAVVVVDEAVLALSDYQLPDPIAAFYQDPGSRVSAEYSRTMITLANPDLLLANSGGGSGDDAVAEGDDGGGDAMAESPDASFAMDEDGGAPTARAAQAQNGADGPAVADRTNFDALALFAPAERTGSDGTVTIDLDLPDNLTRYRVMVVAVDDADRFGSAESNITARLPLMVRPSAPRFLNFGDEFELPVVLQNQTADDLEVSVVLQTSNLELTDGAGRLVTVPANDRIEVRFPARADDVGTARFRAIAVTEDHGDAASIELPVYTPATAEAFATYGVVDSGAIAQPVLAPTDVIPQIGGLEINTSSTALQALTDAVIYLTDYRYESADAYASRMIAIAALRDVLEAFEADGLPTPAQFEDRMAADIAGLIALQNGDGGFGWWRRDGRSNPFVSIHATHALVEARNAGYAVADGPLEAALIHLADIERYYPDWYGEDTRNTLSAYALHVRFRAGDADSAKALELYRSADLQSDALAWLWPVISDESVKAEIARNFGNRATETAGAATFATSYGDDAHVILHSDRRTDGIVLGALLSEDATSDLVPKVVAGLLGAQKQGRWGNSQENAFILLALNDYFDTFENVDPDFVARVWLGDTYAGEHEYQGRSTDRGQTNIGMQELLDLGDSDLVVAKEGEGRLYYRLGLRYAPADFDLDPLDRGFVVQRSYEAVDDDDDVWQDDDGVWHVKAGANVRVRLTMVADSRRVHAMLLDPLAAGLEPVNGGLANAAVVPEDDGQSEYRSWWWGRWYDHENLRDDRVEIYTPVLSAGSYDYSYVARATTPGTFVVPPARAEEIYAPETFGRSASETLVVEP